MPGASALSKRTPAYRPDDGRYSRNATPANVGARAGNFDPAKAQYNRLPGNTLNLTNVLATALRNSALVGILFEGDSKIAGLGTNGGASINAAASMPGNVRRLLGGRGYTIAGTGYVTGNQNAAAGTGDNRWTYGTGWSQSLTTNSNFAQASTSGAVLTFTSDLAGENVRIITPSNSASFIIKIDGAFPLAGNVSVTAGSYTAATGVFVPAGSSVLNIITITGQTNAAHAVTITTSSASTVYLTAIAVGHPTGLDIHNIGICSSTSTDWIASTFYQTKTLAQTIPCTVVMVALGVNDAKAAISIATYKSNMGTIITGHQGGGRDVILIVPTPPQTTQVTTAVWNTYVNAIYDLADTYGVPVIDLTAIYQTWSNANTKGFMYDSLHENDQGYAVDGLAVLTAIGA
jgi:lysophospholipase L1-like esterase